MHTGILVLATLCLFGASSNAIKFCELNYPEDYPAIPAAMTYTVGPTWPVNVVGQTKAGTTLYTVNNRLKLYCTGENNVINSVNKPTLEIMCASTEKWVSLDGKTTYDFKKLGCKTVPYSQVMSEDRKCADGLGEFFDIGPKLGDDETSTVYSICFNQTTKQAFYTYNLIRGSTIKLIDADVSVGQLRADKMGRNRTALNALYTPASQIPHFRNLYGASQSYVTDQSYLKCAQLTPKADYYEAFMQSATEFYMNCVPQFTGLANWKRVENLAREIAQKTKYDVAHVESYTGTLGVLQLESSTSWPINATLDNSGSTAVPAAFFKLVKIPYYNPGVVFITHNDPTAKKADIIQLCPNVCDQAKLNNAAFSDPSQGYTYCCDVKAFKQIYPYLNFVKNSGLYVKDY